MSNKTKMISLYKLLALKLHKQSVWFFRHTFHLKPKRISRTFLKSFLTSKKVDLNKTLLADREYYYITLDEMKDIIKHDWIDRMKYETDIADCDDFAAIFKSHFLERYKINSVGTARSIKITSPSTGEHIGYHRANVFFADDNGLKLYFIEPQTDIIKEITDYNELIRLTGWLNHLNVLDF